MDLLNLYNAIGYTFKEPDLLAEALTHPSSGKSFSYERLEFLGDRILGLVIAEWLYANYPDASEGEIAPKLNELVRKESCANVASDLGLGEFIAFAQGEIDTGGRAKTSILGDIVESVIAAIYLDGGLEPASRFIHTNWAQMFEGADEITIDAKTQLQEWAQAMGRRLPEYVVKSRLGPDHAPVFTVEVTVNGYPTVEGMGTSKRNAERAAATALLAAHYSDDDSDGNSDDAAIG